MIENVKLLFVYNAEKDVLSASLGYLHKVFSPSTYPCELCSITHSNIGERKEWSELKDRSEFEMEFIYLREFNERFNLDVELPAVFYLEGEKAILILSKREISNSKNAEGLMQSLILKLQTN